MSKTELDTGRGNLPRLIPFYLPQFHPIPENDLAWGKGFTEWRNVIQAQPRFRGHYQPHRAGELGYYDLRVPETQIQQAVLAREYGVGAFCYYHYWFHGKQVLEQPFEQVLTSGAPDFPFCLCWANESWTRAWDGRTDRTLLEQTYSEQDDLAHIRHLACAFADPRYVRVQNQPLFLVYRAGNLPDAKRTTDTWRAECQRLGIGDLFLARVESFHDEHTDPHALGFDAAVEFAPDWLLLPEPLRRTRVWRWATRLRLSARAYQTERVYDYATLVAQSLAKPEPAYLRFPCVTPMWDNSARRNSGSVILKNSTPALYEQWLRAVVARTRTRPSHEQIIFINAWNEWAEGNHLEPDARYGRAYLEATQRAMQDAGQVTGLKSQVAGRTFHV